jgi:CBS domain containing-hemolysin-like protein
MGPSTLIAIVFLLLVNALFVAAEFAIVSARRSRIRRRAEAGSGLAQRLLPLLDDPARIDRFISACQLGITVSSLALGAVGQQTLAQALVPLLEGLGGMQEVAAQSLAVAVVLLALTVVQVVLGELVPKSVALQYPNRTALFTLLPVQWTLRVFGPFIALLNGTSQGLARLLKLPVSAVRHVHAPEEIEMLIGESHEAGVLAPAEHERLQQALGLSRVTARHVMVPRPRIVGLDLETPPAAALRTVIDSPYNRLPVWHETIDQVVGVVRTKDLVRHAARHGGLASLEPLVRPVFFVHEGTTADRLIALMRERRSHVAIVMDDFGGVSGLVTIEAVLAEVFGEVGDEFRAETTGIARLPDGSFRVPGGMRLSDACAELGTEWDGTAATVGGYVVERLGRLPRAGESVELEGARVTVEQADDRVVGSVVVTLQPAGSEDG